MSEEQLKAFWEAIQADAGLQEKLISAADADTVLAIAKEEGFSITADYIKQAQAEVSDEELEGVTGGFGYKEIENNLRGVAGPGLSFAYDLGYFLKFGINPWKTTENS